MRIPGGARRLFAQLKQPMVLACGGFLLVAGGISANALLLQPGRHPAPLFAAGGGRAVTAPQADPLVAEIQAALRGSGWYGGPVDGIMGAVTEQAIRAFEQEAGMAPTGRASSELLAAVRRSGGGATEPADPARFSPVEEPAPLPEVAAVQRALARAAYGPIRTDGVFGPQTRDAIARFQADHGLPATGEMSEALVLELRAAGALDE